MTPAATSPLLMLRLLPDMAALGRWVAATGQRALRDDAGYALHAALRATLGELAPKPFALMERPGSVQLIGYTKQPAPALERALDMAHVADPAAALALGLGATPGTLIKPMPDAWRAGERLSFEVRVVPVVRSRAAPGPAGAYPEVDAAYHPAFAGSDPGDREAAHARWLARELARDGAATLLAHRALAFQLTPMARRGSRASTGSAPNAESAVKSRSTHHGLLPDLTVRGQLRIDSGEAFQQLLARGLGRHRSFGYGCLLLAPAGAWA
jgi:CRISPR system Cascade subunit CasE